ncbi:MAG TPA: hypothetical protein VEA99_13665 [Gemmatimonadaceae bacterium]|nr:hypothetical protein [Gemmatimonadaceae bacterium]
MLAYFAARHAVRYAAVWEEFVSLAKVDGERYGPAPVGLRYAFDDSQQARRRVPARPRGQAAEIEQGVVIYRATRLTFKRDLIEPLDAEARFRCVTPAGAFEMSKQEFYEAFPRVPLTASYREAGVYHFPRVPRAAEPFRVPDSERPIDG